MKKLLAFLTMVRFIVARNKTNLVFELDDRLFELHGSENLLSRIKGDAGGYEVISRRRLLEIPDVSAPTAFPSGSLGRVYAEHMVANGLDPNFYISRGTATELDFCITRIRQTHDLWHVVTGFETDGIGEMALQAFSLSYLGLPTSMVILSAMLAEAAIINPNSSPQFNRLMSEGFRSGARVAGLFAYDWAANWNKPLNEVRAELNIEVNCRHS